MSEDSKELKFGQPKRTRLPIVKPGIEFGLVEDSNRNPELLDEYFSILESENPILAETIVKIAEAKSGGNDELMAKLMDSMLIICKQLEAQTEADILNKEGG